MHCAAVSFMVQVALEVLLSERSVARSAAGAVGEGRATSVRRMLVTALYI